MTVTTLLTLLFCIVRLGCSAQSIQDRAYPPASPYPYEPYFQAHIAGAIDSIAAEPYGQRNRSVDNCPDTRRLVYSFALEGEAVTSPYTGRKFIQGPTGYFGAKSRDVRGRIATFGGDPLKYDLPPMTARLLRQPNDTLVMAFLSVPGNLVQQYHFAASHWARFYGLVADRMSADWHADFRAAVSDYAETRRPSDGTREHNPMDYAYDMVGTPGGDGVLGGTRFAGGTENHKIMWRTTALLYSQWFPDSARISNYATAEAERLTFGFLQDFVRRLGRTGHGEFDSEIYYPHSIQAFLNLYDFAKKPEHKQLAKTALDYYFATYALKTYHGSIAGAQKRGGLPKVESEMAVLLRAFADTTNLKPLPVPLAVATTTYRPNRVICNLFNKNVILPFSAQMSRPNYPMDKKNVTQESFYASNSFGLGNAPLTMVDNPNQQVAWSLVAPDGSDNLVFMGQQPQRGLNVGHSPYTQTLHDQGTIIVMSAPTQAGPSGVLSTEQAQRQQHAGAPLAHYPQPNLRDLSAVETFIDSTANSAATWLMIPKGVEKTEEDADGIFMEAGDAFIYVRPFGDWFWVDIPTSETAFFTKKGTRQTLTKYRILVCNGQPSGYVLESAEKSKYRDLTDFKQKVSQKARLNLSKYKKNALVEYRSFNNRRLKMKYRPDGLRADGWIDGTPLDYASWADGGVYDSPYLKIKNGRTTVTDGRESFVIDLDNP
ncbi:hypothetical protein [Persicitalea sp.]|uniref:hypothetical protein n=1 Tax=Persicitalea sp. TaxID=3100273 RepID=UPI003593AF2D